jgi:hypothetical protein
MARAAVSTITIGDRVFTIPELTPERLIAINTAIAKRREGSITVSDVAGFHIFAAMLILGKAYPEINAEFLWQHLTLQASYTLGENFAAQMKIAAATFRSRDPEQGTAVQ